eukprot:6193700-Pleurochrysis_carterae.AAC.2
MPAATQNRSAPAGAASTHQSSGRPPQPNASKRKASGAGGKPSATKSKSAKRARKADNAKPPPQRPERSTAVRSYAKQEVDGDKDSRDNNAKPSTAAAANHPIPMQSHPSSTAASQMMLTVLTRAMTTHSRLPLPAFPSSHIHCRMHQSQTSCSGHRLTGQRQHGIRAAS